MRRRPSPTHPPPQQHIWVIYYKPLSWMFRPFWGEFPPFHQHLGWLLGGKGRYKLPRTHSSKLGFGFMAPGGISSLCFFLRPNFTFFSVKMAVVPLNFTRQKDGFLGCHHPYDMRGVGTWNPTDLFSGGLTGTILWLKSSKIWSPIWVLGKYTFHGLCCW